MSTLIIACAGSGKTTHLVSRALAHQRNLRTLIVTYTNQNRSIIEDRLHEKMGCIPSWLVVDTWYSWMLRDCIRPYSKVLFSMAVNGLFFQKEGSPRWQHDRYLTESDSRYFMTTTGLAHPDRAAKFAVRIDERSAGKVVARLKKIYDVIYIDEVQDLAGYDLDLIGRICSAGIRLEMAGDPRQATYATHSEPRNQSYRGKHIGKFFQDYYSDHVQVDESTLSVSHRCCAEICAQASRLFEGEFPEMITGNHELTSHDGISFIAPSEIESYLRKYQAIQLRYNATSRHVSQSHPVMNIGVSKGATFSRTVLFLTKDMINWMRGQNVELKEQTKAMLYVALTRARHSAAIVEEVEPAKSQRKKK